MAFKAWHVPVRLATGAYILNSGLQKRNADKETAAGLHGFASSAFPEVADMPPERFASLLSAGEIAVGAALLTPFVPTATAGAALSTFSGMLMRLYLKTPGLREEGSLRPSQAGGPVSKDVWMVGIGTALLLDAISDRLHGRGKARD
ncbi:MAG TPA: hypothetical protein VK306_03105 [Acidimicrobiales bacterium]|nr:hypothetical protein [Acidimicrobiales bacterium]